MVYQKEKKADPLKIALTVATGIIIIGGSVYAAYLYSQKQAGNIMLPAGSTYLGPSPTTTPTPMPTVINQPPTAPLRFTAPPNDTWQTQGGKLYSYTFSYPSSLPLVIFPDDETDSVAIAWGNIPAQQNILINIELIDKRDAKYVTQPKLQYVRNWYKFFSGLRGVSKVENFTNKEGLKGYKAIYINYANATPNVDVFLEIPNDSGLMIHLANGILDPVLFEKIVDSVKWVVPSPTSTRK